METDKRELFLTSAKQKVSDLIKLCTDLNTAIGVLSQNEHSSKNDSAINTLNKLMVGLMQCESNHYKAMDTALDEALEKLKMKKQL